ncbi:hypothetical protein Tco_0622471 [Tanacetum coccineum]
MTLIRPLKFSPFFYQLGRGLPCGDSLTFGWLHNDARLQIQLWDQGKRTCCTELALRQSLTFSIVRGPLVRVMSFFFATSETSDLHSLSSFGFLVLFGLRDYDGVSSGCLLALCPVFPQLDQSRGACVSVGGYSYEWNIALKIAPRCGEFALSCSGRVGSLGCLSRSGLQHCVTAAAASCFSNLVAMSMVEH